jgi:alpha-L-rhamnosidase
MTKKIFPVLFLLTVLASCKGPSDRGLIQPVNLRCEYRTNPMGINTLQPGFSWEFISEARGQNQTAYEILVSGDPDKLAAGKGNMWSSGVVRSGENIQVVYEGKSLEPGTRYYWKVRAWDRDGHPSLYSEPAWFETGLGEENWEAKWIWDGREAPATEAGMYLDIPVPLYRYEFPARQKVVNARLYICGLGYYEAFLNGKKVGDRMLDPGWTNYGKRIQYSTYDVTDMLKEGDNAIGVILGNGWFNPLPLYLFNRLNLRDVLTIGQPMLIARLKLEYDDATVQWVHTGEDWKAGEGPILRNNVYLGEVYDARLEQDGWTEPGFDDSRWKPALKTDGPGGWLIAQIQPPIRVTKEITPVAITEPRPGVYIVDMGQNFAGVARLKVEGEAGTRVQMRYGELLYDDGTLNDLTTIACHIRENWYYQHREGHPRNADQRDIYILKGSGEEVYNSRFTFHGFRYVELTGFPGKPTIESVTGLRMNSDLEDAGDFTCSNKLFNQIQQNVEWTFLSNVFSIESDCPGREKFGYGGDIVTAGEAYIYNYQMPSFYIKTVHDYQDDQRPSGGMPELAPDNTIYDMGLTEDTGPIGWMLAHPFLQDRLIVYYGDKRLIGEQYQSTVRLVEFIRQQAPEHIVTGGISDHASIDPKPEAVTSTAFYYHHVQLLARFAGILGKTEDKEKYNRLSEEIKKAFINEFVDNGTVDAGTQGAQAFALYYGLLPEGGEQAAMDILEEKIVEENKGHLSTGIFGTKMMYDVFRIHDRNDLGFLITSQKDFPGYGYMIENGGTTIWESWRGGLSSYNHPMFGSVSEWFYKSIAGICPEEDATGFDRFIIKPGVVGDLEWVKSSYHSVRGIIRSDWDIVEGGLHLDIEIPVNTTATLYIPSENPEQVMESGLELEEAEGILEYGQEGKYTRIKAGSGQYHFVSEME